MKESIELEQDRNARRIYNWKQEQDKIKDAEIHRIIARDLLSLTRAGRKASI